MFLIYSCVYIMWIILFLQFVGGFQRSRTFFTRATRGSRYPVIRIRRSLNPSLTVQRPWWQRTCSSWHCSPCRIIKIYLSNPRYGVCVKILFIKQICFHFQHLTLMFHGIVHEILVLSSIETLRPETYSYLGTSTSTLKLQNKLQVSGSQGKNNLK